MSDYVLNGEVDMYAAHQVKQFASAEYQTALAHRKEIAVVHSKAGR